jgi:hypothetical protein
LPTREHSLASNKHSFTGRACLWSAALYSKKAQKNKEDASEVAKLGVS